MILLGTLNYEELLVELKSFEEDVKSFVEVVSGTINQNLSQKGKKYGRNTAY